MGTILTADLLSTGKPYPPHREQNRVSRMQRWYNRSNRQFGGMFADDASASQEARFSALSSGSTKRLSPNLYRFMLNFWKVAVTADAPVVSYEGNTRTNDFIERAMPSVNDALGEVVVDLIRYGCGVIVCRKPFRTEAVDPRFWFPIRTAFDENEGSEDVIAFPYSDNATADVSPNKIAVFHYTPTSAIERHYRFASGSIGALVSEERVPASAVPVVSVSSDSTLFGRSDYEDTDVYITELFRRESIVSRALDKQASPHLVVPQGSLDRNADGSYDISAEGTIFPVPHDTGQTPHYVSWEATFAAQTEAIKRAEARIYQLTGISQILIEPQVRSAALTGAALRRLAAPTVSKIRLLRDKLSKAIRDTLVGQASLIANSGGEVFEVDPDQIEILWRPELSGGLSDESDALSTLIGAGVISQQLGIQIATGLNQRQAAEAADASANAMENTNEQN